MQSLVLCLTDSPVLLCPSNPMRWDVCTLRRQVARSIPGCNISADTSRVALPFFLASRLVPHNGGAGRARLQQHLAAVCSLLVVSDKEHCCGPTIIRHRATWNINRNSTSGPGPVGLVAALPLASLILPFVPPSQIR